jgi:hypothetical protein
VDNKELENLCKALKYSGDSVSKDEPLNYLLARGIDSIAEAISDSLDSIANAVEIAARIIAKETD